MVRALERGEGVGCPECGVRLRSEEVMRVVSVDVLRCIGRGSVAVGMGGRWGRGGVLSF